MIANDDDTYDSMSEEVMEALERVAMHRRVNEDEDVKYFVTMFRAPLLLSPRS